MKLFRTALLVLIMFTLNYFVRYYFIVDRSLLHTPYGHLSGHETVYVDCITKRAHLSWLIWGFAEDYMGCQRFRPPTKYTAIDYARLPQGQLLYFQCSRISNELIWIPCDGDSFRSADFLKLFRFWNWPSLFFTIMFDWCYNIVLITCQLIYWTGFYLLGNRQNITQVKEEL